MWLVRNETKHVIFKILFHLFGSNIQTPLLQKITKSSKISALRKPTEY